MREVFVAVELSFKLSTPMEVLRDSSLFVSSSGWLGLGLGLELGLGVAMTVALRSVLLSGELGRLGSLLSQVLVSELVLGVVVQLTPTEAVFMLELESELTLLALKLATEMGKWSWLRTFW